MSDRRTRLEQIANVGVDRFRSISREKLKACDAILQSIIGAAGPRGPRNTLRPLNDLLIELGEVHRAVSLMRSVHPVVEIRQAAEECEQEIAAFATELGLNRALFEAVKACDPNALDDVGKRCLSRLLRDFHRAGVDRDEPTRVEVRRLRNELVSLSQEFARNILEDVRSIQLDGEAELDGLPRDYVESHPPDPGGKITITTDYPDYNPFMSYARSNRRREELYRIFRQRAHPDNVGVLERILEKRHRLATLLDYAHWAAYVTEDKMIRTADKVLEFIERVSAAAAARSDREYADLLERKRQDEPDAVEVHDWEKGYYEEILRSERFQIDSRDLRPYFRYDLVKDGVLSTLAELFGVEFRAVDDVETWHEDVEVLDVLEGGRRVGRVYLDMHPREGKFKHAAMFPLVQGILDRRVPEAALVCNFPNPRTSPATAFLEHDDIVTFFHEFGHLLHHLFARDLEWVEFSGTGTEWDFVEVPSQLMEEWAWDVDVLQRFARHGETGEVIPAHLVDGLHRAREFGLGLYVRQQMFYASLSLKCHDRDPADLDIDRLLRDLHNRYSRFRFVDGTHFHASFGHLDNYSALYYTYMWSLVIEKDLLSVFRRRRLMDRSTAARYRAAVLAPGGSRDGADLAHDFLGRPYNFDAFERWLDDVTARE